MFEQILFILMLVTISSLYTQSYNLAIGYTGIFHLAHAAFIGIGAYTAAILSVNFGTPFLITLPLSFIIAAITGLLVGIPAIRLRSHYLALATLGFGEIIRLIFLNWTQLTNGPLGINKIPAPKIFGLIFDTNGEKLFLYAIIAALIHFLIYKIAHSSYGKVLESIREDEVASESLGKKVVQKKLQILAISAGFGGMAGALYAHGLHFIDPSLWNIPAMVFTLVMLITGGIGNFWGAILGPLVIYAIFEPLRFLGSSSEIFGIELNIGALRMMLYALTFIIIILLRPEGILSRLKKLEKK